MIKTLTIQAFKSLEDVSIDLGQINVFIGANGSGKSNLLEAVGVLSAAAEGKVTDQTLLQRGVRPGVPKLYKSAFKKQISSHIRFSAMGGGGEYEISLHNPLKEPSPAWRFKSERWQDEENTVLAGRSPKKHENPEHGLAALKAVEVQEDKPAKKFLRCLQDYVIYMPTTAVLRGTSPEMQPRRPVGLSGGRLPEAVSELLRRRSQDEYMAAVCREALGMIDWAKSYGTAPSAQMPLSPAAAASPRVIRFKDRFMKESRNVLSGYDASEGALYVLLLAVLAAHERSPLFFAVDNVDHGLNPGLVKTLMERFSNWVLEASMPRQILMTTHNPAALDGLPLQDDRVRLFTVDRDNYGMTAVRRIVVDEKLLSYAKKGWTLSRLWMNKLIGGMPDV
ncbi:MAG: AAA family ATPase [Gammaproteobacteria bacterium]|nr:AAA family ATPase [Gammaproteobacteria bacterium]